MKKLDAEVIQKNSKITKLENELSLMRAKIVDFEKAKKVYINILIKNFSFQCI